MLLSQLFFSVYFTIISLANYTDWYLQLYSFIFSKICMHYVVFQFVTPKLALVDAIIMHSSYENCLYFIFFCTRNVHVVIVCRYYILHNNFTFLSLRHIGIWITCIYHFVWFTIFIFMNYYIWNTSHVILETRVIDFWAIDWTICHFSLFNSINLNYRFVQKFCNIINAIILDLWNLHN